MAKAKMLYVTDLYYPAVGRRYYEEDLFLSGFLRQDFDLVLCHPLDTAAFEADVDVIVCRNTGPVMHYEAAYEAFRERCFNEGYRVYNPLTGKGDMQGKQYLIDLFKAGYAVIPSVEDLADWEDLPACERYMLKQKRGADSIGMAVIEREEVPDLSLKGAFLQPFIDFEYEVSFYFVDADFQYALYAPDKNKRWELQIYAPNQADLAFAEGFIEWNGMDYGIQRVDACRTVDGRLLLMELEDLNPYLSLAEVPGETQNAFIEALRGSLGRLF
ncbi:hypothetical protein MASR2M15_07480 [Anaerolineales bacterium]